VGARPVALDDALNSEQTQEQIDQETAELRKALIQTQKQLAKAKLRNEELVAATHRGAYEAMLALGKVKPVPAPTIDKRRGCTNPFNRLARRKSNFILQQRDYAAKSYAILGQNSSPNGIATATPPSQRMCSYVWRGYG